jgi:3-methylcrotonyl-CoA carboxylase beta subunit
MGSEQAVGVLTQVRVASMKRQGLEPDPDELARIEAEVGEHFESTANPYHLTSELRDDGLIDPTDTRNTLGMALSAALCAPITRRPGGVLRI